MDASNDPRQTGSSRMSALVDELVRDNAMMDEATRYMRQMMRTGGDTGKGANLVILGIIGLFYMWFLATMIRYDFSVTVPLEYAQLVLVTLVAPVSIYAAISGEREKATWDALVLTRLTPAQIIAGKLAWRIIIVAGIMGILLIAIFISQFMGSGNGEFGTPPTWTAVLAGQVMIFAWGVFLCAFSLWVSSRTKQAVTTIALVITTLLGVLVALPSLLSMFDVSMHLGRSGGLLGLTGYVLLWANPFLLLWTVTGRTSNGYGYNPRDLPPIDPVAWAFLLGLLFLLAAVLFVYSAHAGICRLEEPVRKG